MTNKYAEEVLVELHEPLRELLRNLKDIKQSVNETWRSEQEKFLDIRNRVDASKSNYFTAHKVLDNAVESYNKTYDKMRTSPDKKKKLGKNITKLLQNCKATERDYTTLIFAVKEARVKYIKGIVIKK